MKFLSKDEPWRNISGVLDKTNTKVLCAIGYIGMDAPNILKLGAGDVLVCDASDATVKSGSTYPEALMDYAKAGVHIYSVSGLHAKVIVCGNNAWIGSMNASTSSKNLVEAAIRLDNKPMVQAALDFINDQKNLMPPLSKSEIRRLINLPRRKSQRVTGKSFQDSFDFPKIATSLLTFWTSADTPLTDTKRDSLGAMRKEVRQKSDDELKNDSTLFFIRVPSDFKANRGTWVLEIEEGKSVLCPGVIAEIRGTGRNRYAWIYRPNDSIQSISLKKLNKSLKYEIPDTDDARISADRAEEIWSIFKGVN